MSCCEFAITKSPDEKIIYPVEFISGYGTITIDFAEVFAYDSHGYDVTSEIIDPYYTTFENNLAQFMAINGEENYQYTIKVAVHTTDGQEFVAEGTLTICE